MSHRRRTPSTWPRVSALILLSGMLQCASISPYSPTAYQEELTAKLTELAEQQWTAYRGAAISDGTAFVDEIKAD